jgi:hypothetical protein
MPKIRFIVFFLLTILAAVLVWFWAFRPVFTPLIYLQPTGYGPPPSIWYSIWHFHLVPPKWVGTPPDYPGWEKAEALVRVAVIFICWIMSIIFNEWLYSMRHKNRRSRQCHET